TLAFLLFAPVFVLTLLYVIMTNSSGDPNIGAIHLNDNLQEELTKEAHVTEYPTTHQAMQAMKNQDIDAYMYMKEDTPYIEIEGADATKRSPVLQAVQTSLRAYQKELAENKKADVDGRKGEIGPLVKKVQQHPGESPDIDFPD